MEKEFNFEALNNFMVEKIADFDKIENADRRQGALEALNLIFDKFTTLLDAYYSSLNDEPEEEIDEALQLNEEDI